MILRTVSESSTTITVGRLVAATSPAWRAGAAVGSGRGRPAVPLTVRRGAVHALGLEVNVERLVATVVDLSGELLSVARREVEVARSEREDRGALPRAAQKGTEAGEQLDSQELIGAHALRLPVSS